MAELYRSGSVALGDVRSAAGVPFFSSCVRYFFVRSRRCEGRVSGSGKRDSSGGRHTLPTLG